MAGGHLSHDEFFTQLTTLLDSRQQKGHGSIFLSQKRLTHDLTGSTSDTPMKTADDPLWDTHPPAPLPLVVRATDGNSQSAARVKSRDRKIKLSTVVQPDDLDAFYARYADVCKAGMQSLKKRDRSKRKKAKKGKKGAAGGGAAAAAA